jgi:hypothetical protein
VEQSNIITTDCTFKIHTVDEIINDLNVAIGSYKPWSLIRFGDGGLKFIWAVMMKEILMLNSISKKEGIPITQFGSVLRYWTKYANEANYIDCPQVYMTGNFWPRVKGENKNISVQTKYKLDKWQDLYQYAMFKNTNFCNPEINYISILRRYRKSNLLTIMKDRKICFLTAIPSSVKALRKAGYDVDIIHIVRQFDDHYNKSFPQTIQLIKKYADKYDLFLVAAGELGRIYSGLIKECGGRAFDIGFVAEFWGGKDVHTRLRPFLARHKSSDLELQIRAKAVKFIDFL